MKTYTIQRITGVPEWDKIPALQVDNHLWLPSEQIQMTAQIAYDEEADFEAPFIPLRFNSENELIGICVTGESDLVKVNLNRNKITVLLSGTKFETLIKQKSLDSIMSPNIFTNTRSHNGSEEAILPRYVYSEKFCVVYVEFFIRVKLVIIYLGACVGIQ